MPEVSVIMSVYNGAKYLRESVDSILAQTFHDFEFIIVDDASTDETPQILASYSDERIRVLRNEHNLRQATSRNRALAAAFGRYIAVQDADDVSLQHRLETQITYLNNHPEVGLLGSTTIFMDWDGKELGIFPNPTSDLEAKWAMLDHNAFGHTSVMFRRHFYELLGGYPENDQYCHSEDYVFCLKIAQNSKVENLPTPLVKWRAHAESTSHQNLERQRGQVASVARRNLCWVMGWEEMDPQLWAAWRKFWYTPGVDPVAFEREEVELLAELLLNVTNRFYSAYRLCGPEVRRHCRRVHYLWGRHALGLSYKPGSGSSLAARRALLLLGMKLLATALAPHRGLKTRSGDTDTPPAELGGEADTPVATTQHTPRIGGSSSA